MLKGFKQFLLRGNVVDLAVAVVIGGAFGAVVAALVKDLLTPLIAAIVGQPDFSAHPVHGEWQQVPASAISSTRLCPSSWCRPPSTSSSSRR